MRLVPRLDPKKGEPVIPIIGTSPDLIKPPVGYPPQRVAAKQWLPCEGVDPGATEFSKTHYGGLLESAFDGQGGAVRLSKNLSKNLIEVEGLKKYFNVGKGRVLKAVDNISFSIREGETLGMVRGVRLRQDHCRP